MADPNAKPPQKPAQPPEEPGLQEVVITCPFSQTPCNDACALYTEKQASIVPVKDDSGRCAILLLAEAQQMLAIAEARFPGEGPKGGGR